MLPQANSMNTPRLWRLALLSLMIAGPVGGFLVGLLHAGDPDPNPIGRLVHAFLMAVQTPLHAGFPPNHLAGAPHTINAWPHIIISYLLILGWLVHRDRRLAQRQIPPTA
jgi:hypothetical protein